MKFNPSTGEPTSSSQGEKTPGQMGIRGRVEHVSKAHVPAPKGKGIVMMIIGVAVLGALIWDFTGRGAASQAVRRAHDDGKRPVPKERPDGPVVAPEAPIVAAPAAGPGLVRLEKDGAVLELPPEAAAALLANASDAERPQLRAQILKGLVKAAGRRGTAGRQAFEAATRFQEGAEPESLAALTQLTLRAHAALRDDGAAPAAILFLSRLDSGGGALTAAALDEVIADAARPLHVRIAAANARPDTPKPSAIQELAQDPATHPALREALE